MISPAAFYCEFSTLYPNDAHEMTPHLSFKLYRTILSWFEKKKDGVCAKVFRSEDKVERLMEIMEDVHKREVRLGLVERGEQREITELELKKKLLEHKEKMLEEREKQIEERDKSGKFQEWEERLKEKEEELKNRERIIEKIKEKEIDIDGAKQTVFRMLCEGEELEESSKLKRKRNDE
jgi:hypothetical protein